MENSYSLKLLSLLNAILNSKFLAKDFSGLGIIVYSDIRNLNLISLCKEVALDIDLNTHDYIAQKSSYEKLCHDGFFLIHEDWRVTHESQYVLPKLDGFNDSDIHLSYPVGARYVTALLASKISGILCSGTIGVAKNINIFEFGNKAL